MQYFYVSVGVYLIGCNEKYCQVKSKTICKQAGIYRVYASESNILYIKDSLIAVQNR